MTATSCITGDGRRLALGQLAELYKFVVGVPILSSAQIEPVKQSLFKIACNYSVQDCDASSNITYRKTSFVSVKQNIETIIGPTGLDRVSSEELAVVNSDNNSNQLRLVKTSNEKGDKLQHICLYNGNRHVKSLNTAEIEGHGAVIEESEKFQSINWCPLGQKLLYVAHEKVPKHYSYFDQVPDYKTPLVGMEFEYKQSWGEAIADVFSTVIGILDTGNKEYKISTIKYEGHSLAKPLWLGPDGQRFICQAYPEQPNKLGMVYCNNRPCKLLIYDLKDTSCPKQVISPEGKSFHSIRVSNTGDKVVALVTETYGPHNQPSQIVLMSQPDFNIENIVDEPIFIQSLPEKCFSSDDRTILFVKADILSDSICTLNLEKRTMNKISFPTQSAVILDLRQDLVVALGSQFDIMPTPYIAKLQSSDDNLDWHPLDECVCLSDTDITAFSFKPSLESKTDISAILITPKLNAIQKYCKDEQRDLITSTKKLPTVVMAHGGPHGHYNYSYATNLAFYSKLGLNTLLINYRGSTGVNKEHNSSLCGHIGDMDVKDCLLAIRSVVEQGHIDPNNLVFRGGSHSGLIGCHLSCQDEFKFTSVIIRNPVVDLTSMYVTSDIPDWVFNEGLGIMKHDHAKVPTEQEIAELWHRSASSKATSASPPPTLVHLGDQDLRVPMSQGLRWVKILQARGVETSLKIYPAGHDLSAKAKVTSDSEISIALWILRFVRRA